MFIHSECSMILCPWFVQSGCAISIHDITHLPTLLPIGPISVLDMKVLQCHICYNYYHKLSNNKKQAQHLPFIASPSLQPNLSPSIPLITRLLSLRYHPPVQLIQSHPPAQLLPLCPTDSTQSSSPTDSNRPPSPTDSKPPLYPTDFTPFPSHTDATLSPSPTNAKPSCGVPSSNSKLPLSDLNSKLQPCSIPTSQSMSTQQTCTQSKASNTCYICGKVYAFKSGLSKHLKKEHRDESYGEAKGYLICNLCQCR